MARLEEEEEEGELVGSVHVEEGFEEKRDEEEEEREEKERIGVEIAMTVKGATAKPSFS